MTSRFNHQAALVFRQPKDLFGGGNFTHTFKFIGRWEDDPCITRPPKPFVVSSQGSYVAATFGRSCEPDRRAQPERHFVFAVNNKASLLVALIFSLKLLVALIFSLKITREAIMEDARLPQILESNKEFASVSRPP